METEDTYKTLEANRDLLDPEFEGYRLSLDEIPGYQVELWRGNRQYIHFIARDMHCAIFVITPWICVHFI